MNLKSTLNPLGHKTKKAMRTILNLKSTTSPNQPHQVSHERLHFETMPPQVLDHAELECIRDTLTANRGELVAADVIA